MCPGVLQRGQALAMETVNVIPAQILPVLGHEPFGPGIKQVPYPPYAIYIRSAASSPLLHLFPILLPAESPVFVILVFPFSPAAICTAKILFFHGLEESEPSKNCSELQLRNSPDTTESSKHVNRLHLKFSVHLFALKLCPL